MAEVKKFEKEEAANVRNIIEEYLKLHELLMQDIRKVENKAAAVRARKLTSAIGKVFKNYRQCSIK